MRDKILIAFPAALLLAIWSAGSVLLGARLLPGPTDVLVVLFKEMFDARIWTAVLGTTSRALISFAIAAVIGIIVGVLPGSAGPLRRGTDAVLDFMRSIPGPALLPVFMVFGLYSGPKIALAVFVCSLVNAVYTGIGVRVAARSLRVRMAKSFGATQRLIYREVILPTALESIMGGLRVTLSLALLLSVLAELVLMTGSGLGVLIRTTYEDRDIAEMYAFIITCGILGTALNSVFARLERRLTWYGDRKVPLPSANLGGIW